MQPDKHTPVEAALTIPKTATAGKNIAFTVTASSSNAVVAKDESFTVARKASPTPTPTDSSSSGSHHGSGGHHNSGGASSGNLGGSPGGVGADTIPPFPGGGATLPGSGLTTGSVPGVGGLPTGSVPRVGGLPRPAATTDPAAAFPEVTPKPSSLPSPVALPGPQRVRVANVSGQFPLDGRLIGVQAAGLAVLAAAVTIAVARMSLRRRAARNDKLPA